MKHEFLSHTTREEAVDFAARMAAGVLEAAIEDSGRASFLVSGGSTPILLFDRLANTELAWDRVTVGLVDERWVSPVDAGSNERLVRHHLLTGKAGAAGFVPMKTDAPTASKAVADRAMAYKPHCDPIDLILLGMGNDGHTASWFPGSKGLKNAMHAQADVAVAAVDATGCPVAGSMPHRLTLTGPAIVDSDAAILLMFGADKRDVFEAALKSDPAEKPIRFAVDGLGPRLTVIWAP
ncbi:MAG: 6-phosphogluconolactonase [Hyphomonas sp.]